MYYLVIETFKGLHGEVEKGKILTVNGVDLCCNDKIVTRKGSFNCMKHCKEIKIEQ